VSSTFVSLPGGRCSGRHREKGRSGGAAAQVGDKCRTRDDPPRRGPLSYQYRERFGTSEWRAKAGVFRSLRLAWGWFAGAIESRACFLAFSLVSYAAHVLRQRADVVSILTALGRTSVDGDYAATTRRRWRDERRSPIPAERHFVSCWCSFPPVRFPIFNVMPSATQLAWPFAFDPPSPWTIDVR